MKAPILHSLSFGVVFFREGQGQWGPAEAAGYRNGTKPFDERCASQFSWVLWESGRDEKPLNSRLSLLPSMLKPARMSRIVSQHPPHVPGTCQNPSSGIIVGVQVKGAGKGRIWVEGAGAQALPNRSPPPPPPM